jgi:hypothetical protein
MIAAEYASPMPGSDFSSSCEAELISINLLEVEPLDAGLLVGGCLAFEPLGAWYGAAASVSAVTRRRIHLAIFMRCSSQRILLCRGRGFLTVRNPKV